MILKTYFGILNKIKIMGSSLLLRCADKNRKVIVKVKGSSLLLALDG